jgi:transposase
MAKRKFDNDSKVMILDLLKSGIKSSQLSDDYKLTQSMINRWKKEYASKLGDFSKKRGISP